MNCKFCSAELEEDVTLCPICGKENTEDAETVSAQMPELFLEEIAEDLAEEPLDLTEEPEQKPKRKVWKILLAVGCCVVLLAALAVVVLQGMGIDLGPRENDIDYKDSYTVSDKVAVRKANDVVATIGDAELTNAQLQVYYWLQVNEFLNYYGTSYFDYKQPLDEQIVSENTGRTWQQYFIETAIENWQRHQLLTLLADEADYEIVDKYRDSLDDVYQDLEDMAAEYDFESADAMIKADMGAACSAENYVSYMELYNVAMLFLNEQYEQITPTTEELETYYTENEDSFISSGITKDSGSLVDVRHVLVQLDGVEVGSNGKVEYTDTQWEECRQQAQKLLDDWKAGAADEDAFAELANTHSKDGGSNTNGGLYTQVAEGDMVTAFNDWIFDESRVTGDTGLVKTEFGYHIMYFVGSEEQWIIAARTNMISDRIDEIEENAKTRWPLEVDFKKIALTNIEM